VRPPERTRLHRSPKALQSPSLPDKELLSPPLYQNTISNLIKCTVKSKFGHCSAQMAGPLALLDRSGSDRFGESATAQPISLTLFRRPNRTVVIVGSGYRLCISPRKKHSLIPDRHSLTTATRLASFVHETLRFGMGPSRRASFR